jgi:hypothetical protein
MQYTDKKIARFSRPFLHLAEIAASSNRRSEGPALLRPLHAHAFRLLRVATSRLAIVNRTVKKATVFGAVCAWRAGLFVSPLIALAGCIPLNIPRDGEFHDTKASVYDIEPPEHPATEPSPRRPSDLPEQDDGTVPFYGLRKWLENPFGEQE